MSFIYCNYSFRRIIADPYSLANANVKLQYLQVRMHLQVKLLQYEQGELSGAIKALHAARGVVPEEERDYKSK